MTIGKQAPIGLCPLANLNAASFESREHSIHGLLADRCDDNKYMEVKGRYFCQLCNAHLKLCPKHEHRCHIARVEVALML